MPDKANNLIVEMIPDKETPNKMRFKEPKATLNKNLHKSPVGTFYLPKDTWGNATRIRITVEDISYEE